MQSSRLSGSKLTLGGPSSHVTISPTVGVRQSIPPDFNAGSWTPGPQSIVPVINKNAQVKRAESTGRNGQQQHPNIVFPLQSEV